MRKIRMVAFVLGMSASVGFGQNVDLAKLKAFENQLEDVMELMDTNNVKSKLAQTELDFKSDSNKINATRLGIVYHEAALNLSFLSKTNYKGYAKKSFDVLNNLSKSKSKDGNILPIIEAYKASALALVSAETRNLKQLSQAFNLFEVAVKQYADVSYLPQFLRGSVAENLPWFMYKKAKFVKLDMQAIIEKQAKNSNYANAKTMSFVFWAWANQHQSKKFRTKALGYLNKAIELDPNYNGGRKRAEELIKKWNLKNNLII